MFHRIAIRSYEKGLYFKNREFLGLLNEGKHWIFDPLGRVKVEIVSLRQPWLTHEKLDLIVKSGVLEGYAIVLDLADHERALVWIDGRFSHVLSPGLYAYWISHRKVKVEVIDARTIRFDHAELPAILKSPLIEQALEQVIVPAEHQGVLFIDGQFKQALPAGRYVFWRGLASVKVEKLDLRETVLDIAGQDIMTADKVTLRLNAVATYRIVDARLALAAVDNVQQALYRETQLALRAIVGQRELDALLTEKDAVIAELEAQVKKRAQALGLELIAVGIRDVILPGDMKELLNKVTEAKKAAEANLIVRREETAAARSQANTAKLLQENPTLMRLKELETLERIAAAGKLNVFLGDKGLADKIVNLL